MSELKRDYWSDTLVCITGKVRIDRREIAAIVENGYLDIHLKSGSIFTVKQGHWDVNTIANLYLTQSPHEEVHTVPNPSDYDTRTIRPRKDIVWLKPNTFTIREGKAPESEE